MLAKVTLWPSLIETRGEAVELPWPELFERFSRADQFRGDNAHPGWSAAWFEPAQRKKENVKELCALVLDYDGTASLDEITRTWGKYFGFVHATRRNAPEYPRYRVILPFAVPVTPAEYAELWLIAHKLSNGKADKSTKDESRFWFTPGMLNGRPFECATLSGQPIAPALWLALYRVPQEGNGRPAQSSSARERAYAARALQSEVSAVASAEDGQRNATLNNAALKTAQLAAAGHLSADNAIAALAEAAASAGLTREETVKTIQSGWQKGLTQPRQIPAARPVEQKSTEPPRDPFEWQGSASLLTVELGEAPWLIKGLQLGPGRPCGLWGYGGTGKSWIAIAQALAVASGQDFLARFPVRRGRVRHLSHEMGLRTLRERYRALASGLLISLDMLEGNLEVSAYPRVYLNSQNAEELYSRAFEGIAFGIIDSLRRALPGEDENDSSISNYLDILSRVSNNTGTTFEVLHHSGKSAVGTGSADEPDKRGAGRGSSAIFDGSSVVWVVENGTGPRKLTHVRAHEDAGDILVPFYIDMPVVGVGDEPFYVGTQQPRRLVILDEEDVKRINRASLLKGNLAAFEETAEHVFQLIREKGPQSLRGILRALGDSRKNRTVVKELADEGRLSLGSQGYELGDPQGRQESSEWNSEEWNED